MRYQAYPEYKDSGVSWFGSLPKSWNVTFLKYLCCKITDGSHHSPVSKSEGKHYVTVKDVSNGSVNLELSSRISEADFLQLEKAGCRPQVDDILFSKDGTVGKIAYCYSDDFVVLSSLAILRPDKVKLHSRYLYYFLHGSCGVQQIESNYAGAALRRITLDIIVNLMICCPSVAEQIRIANVLDHETAKIDTLIEKQHQLIALLKEKRQAVISHAVTKGLNPEAPMKDSGVEWLGEVPEHWETGSLRWYIKIASGEGLSNTNFEKSKDDNCVYPVVGGNGVFGFSPYFNTITQALAIGRVGALCGNVHLINKKCWITDNAFKLSYWRAFYSKFLHFLLYAARLNEFASTTAQPLITGEQVKALHVVIPPIPEQQQISHFVDHETAKMDILIEKQLQAISLMRERRTALISAAVTGKIDVRDWQPPTDKDIQ